MNPRVYHLEVTVPPGCAWPYSPPDWVAHCQYHGWLDAHGGAMEFSWPARRNFLSRAAAQKQAARLRRWGAIVEVRRSKPVEYEDAPLAHVPVPSTDLPLSSRAFSVGSVETPQ